MQNATFNGFTLGPARIPALSGRALLLLIAALAIAEALAVAVSEPLLI
jgi:hypothetical protein